MENLRCVERTYATGITHSGADTEPGSSLLAWLATSEAVADTYQIAHRVKPKVQYRGQSTCLSIIAPMRRYSLEDSMSLIALI